MELAILLGWFGGYEIVIIGIVVLLFFGGKKLPAMMKDLGKGIKDVKKAADENDLTKDIKNIGNQINDINSTVKKVSNPREFLKKK